MAQDKKKVQITVSAKDNASKTLNSLKTRLLSLKNLLVGGIGFVALNRVLKATVGRAQSAETGLKRLGVAMKAASQFSEENVQAFERLSVKLEKLTGFEEEQTLQALSVLQTFGQMTREDMEKSIVATLNMATVFNEDLTQAAIRVGKAYNGQLIGLQRMGVGISKARFDAEGFSAVLDQLQKEQGGQAIARMKGFEGAVKRLSIGFGEAGKEAGKFITANKTIRGGIDFLAGGFNMMSDILRNYRMRQRDASAETRAHTKDLKDQEDALRRAGKAVEDNILISLKRQRVEINRLIDARGRDTDAGKEELSVAKLNTVAKAEVIKLKDRERELTEQINRLEGDKNVQGSKANKDQLEAEAKLLEASRKEEGIIKKQTEAFENLQKAGEAVKAGGERLIEQQERKLQKTEEELAKETDLVRAKLESAKRIAEIEEEAIQKREADETEALTNAFNNLQKLANLKKQFMEEDKQLLLDSLNEEIALRQSQAEYLANIQSAALRKQLTEEDLNATERKVLIQEQEEAIEQLIEDISTVSTATRLQPLIEQFKTLSQTFEGVDSERIKEAMEQASEAIQESITDIKEKKITLTSLVDINSFRQSGEDLGRTAGRAIIKGIEAEIKQHQFNLGDFNLRRPGFTR